MKDMRWYRLRVNLKTEGGQITQYLHKSQNKYYSHDECIKYAEDQFVIDCAFYHSSTCSSKRDLFNELCKVHSIDIVIIHVVSIPQFNCISLRWKTGSRLSMKIPATIELNKRVRDIGFVFVSHNANFSNVKWNKRHWFTFFWS